MLSYELLRYTFVDTNQNRCVELNCQRLNESMTITRTDFVARKCKDIERHYKKLGLVNYVRRLFTNMCALKRVGVIKLQREALRYR